MRGPRGLDSWSSGEGTRTLAGLPARGPPRTRKDSSQAGGGVVSRKDRGGGLEGEGNPRGAREWVEQRDSCRPGWESKEQGRHTVSAR